MNDSSEQWLLITGCAVRARSTDHDKLTAKKRFRHSDLVTDFVTVILSQSEGLGKMALGIVKHAYNRSSQPIGIIWFAVSCRGPVQCAYCGMWIMVGQFLFVL